MDETVARGCALQCAILSPRMRVKAYDIVDVVPYAIRCVQEKEGKEEAFDLFKKGDEFPSYRRITFHTTEPISLRLEYTEEALKQLMPGTHPVVAKMVVNMTDAVKKAENPAVMINFCYDAHGLCYLYNAMAKIQLPPEPEKPKEEPKEPAKEEKKEEKEEKKEMDVEGEEKKEEPKPEEKKEEKKEEPKPKYQTETLQCLSSFNGLTAEQVKEADQQEKAMLKKDEEIRARNHAKNELESYIYNMRDKVTDVYKAYVLDNVRDDFLQKLEATENWLYDDEGYFAKREAFEARLTDLQTIGNPIVCRYKDSQERPEAVSQLTQRLETIERILSTPNEKYDHITDEDKKPVREMIADAQSWLQKMLVEQSNLALTQDPVLKAVDILDRMKNVDALYNKVMSKPKPAPKKEEKKEEEKKTEEKKEEEKEKKTEEEKDEKKEEEKDDNKMDVE